MSLNLASTMIILRQTVAPKNDPDFTLDNQNSHATITYTSSAIHVLVKGCYSEYLKLNLHNFYKCRYTDVLIEKMCFFFTLTERKNV